MVRWVQEPGAGGRKHFSRENLRLGERCGIRMRVHASHWLLVVRSILSTLSLARTPSRRWKRYLACVAVRRPSVRIGDERGLSTRYYPEHWYFPDVRIHSLVAQPVAHLYRHYPSTQYTNTYAAKGTSIRRTQPTRFLQLCLSGTHYFAGQGVCNLTFVICTRKSSRIPGACATARLQYRLVSDVLVCRRSLAASTCSRSPAAQS